YRCDIIGVDGFSDTALLKVKDPLQDFWDEKSTLDGDSIYPQLTTQNYLLWGNSRDTKIGSNCFVFGNPVGQDANSIAKGIVRDNKWCGNDIYEARVESLAVDTSMLPGN
ncbi:serine protease, partial [Dolichospermum sp. ST_sed4]|nr:serine protease [Dolichospermum sp. ST_sed4]